MFPWWSPEALVIPYTEQVFSCCCASVHTSPSAWAALCPLSTFKVLLILPNPACTSHALWSPWSLFYLLSPSIPASSLLFCYLHVIHRIHWLHRIEAFILEVCLSTAPPAPQGSDRCGPSLHPSVQLKAWPARGGEHSGPWKGFLGFSLRCRRTLLRTVLNDSSRFLKSPHILIIPIFLHIKHGETG